MASENSTFSVTGFSSVSAFSYPMFALRYHGLNVLVCTHILSLRLALGVGCVPLGCLVRGRV